MISVSFYAGADIQIATSTVLNGGSLLWQRMTSNSAVQK